MRHRGEVGLRGDHAPLSWDHTAPPSRSDGDHHSFQLDIREGETPRARSRGYMPTELNQLTFPGQSHTTASWAARVAIPLQLLFPVAAARGAS